MTAPNASDSTPFTDRYAAFLAQLEPEETLQVIELLQHDLSAELVWSETLARQEGELLARIAICSDYAELKQIHDQLNALEIDRFLRRLSVRALHESCTHYRDLLAGRALALVAEEMVAKGTPLSLPYALVSMGSDGREEQTLITDQDYLVVYADGGGEVADLLFADFSALLVERLAEIGFNKCTGGIMPSNPTWRGSYSQWRRRLLAIVRYEFEDYAKNLMDLIVLSDARYVAGERQLAEDLTATIRSFQQDYFQVLWGMAKAATEMKLALGFLHRLWTEGSGAHKGEFNLKLLAWAPLVMNIRILAINQGIPATNTVRRIELLEQERSLSHQMAKELSAAYDILTRHRILLQLRVIKGSQKDSYHLNPLDLSADER
ncbi:MAG TPA: putative nucleotidyltransferase substrate binding domain-containing protein [Geobacterales bacterium]|nr:putative nucleotidyltransferase substrate binding domain-containing protein [Geobacterales bacterium]